jgi:hypothetical protein
MKFRKAIAATLLAFAMSITTVVLPANAMQIYVRLASGYTWIIDVQPNYSIDYVKQLIADRSSMPPGFQNLSFRNKILQDGRTLSDYNIQQESTLYVEVATWAEAPKLSLSTASVITPGESISFVASNVAHNCQVTIYWSGVNETIDPSVVSANRMNKTPIMRIQAPSVAGTYTLRSNYFTYECSGGHGGYLSRSIVVGKKVSIVSKLSTSSGYVAKNPIISVSGNLKSGSKSIASKAVSISLMLAGVEVKAITASTNSSGLFSANFAGTTYASGAYTAVVSFESDSTYLGDSKTTAIINLR